MQLTRCDICGKEVETKETGLLPLWAYRKGKDLCPACLEQYSRLEDKLAFDTNQALNKFLGIK